MFIMIEEFSPVGKYKTQLYDNNRQDWLPSSPGIGMHVEVCEEINYYYCDFDSLFD